MNITALFSDDAKYRYWLQVDLGVGPALCAFMLNPSIAGSVSHGIVRSDPTVTVMAKRAANGGYGRLYVLNLFALISTDPSQLYLSPDPVGPDNDAHIDRILATQPDVVVAWGSNGYLQRRDFRCLQRIHAHDITPLCLGLTKYGYPRHPLRLAYAQPLITYNGRFAQSV